MIFFIFSAIVTGIIFVLFGFAAAQIAAAIYCTISIAKGISDDFS